MTTMTNSFSIKNPALLIGYKVQAACLRKGVFLGALVGLALAPCARAVFPAPDGGYPFFNTAEGTDALNSIQFPFVYGNTALGHNALYYSTTGSDNTATGSYSLFDNIEGADNTATGSGALQNANGS